MSASIAPLSDAVATWFDFEAAAAAIGDTAAAVGATLTPVAAASFAGLASALWSPTLNENEVVPDVHDFIATPSSGQSLPLPPHPDGGGAWSTWLPAFDSSVQVTTFPGQAPVGPWANIFPADDVATWTTHDHPAHATDTSPYLAKNHDDDWPLLGTVGWEDVGDFLGHGWWKSVHRYGDEQAIGIVRNSDASRPGDVVPGIRHVVEELYALDLLHGYGLPAVQATGPWAVGSLDGTAGLIYDKVYELNSKQLLGLSPALNETTLRDLLTMREIIDEHHVAIRDFQVLIDHEGGARIADPLGVHTRDDFAWGTWKMLTDMELDGLITRTERSIDKFGK